MKLESSWIQDALCLSPHSSIKLLISKMVNFCPAPQHHGLQWPSHMTPKPEKIDA